MMWPISWNPKNAWQVGKRAHGVRISVSACWGVGTGAVPVRRAKGGRLAGGRSAPSQRSPHTAPLAALSESRA
eukprot:scaffold41065_cov80-Phaeocystis_antarctica.AAC.2